MSPLTRTEALDWLASEPVDVLVVGGGVVGAGAALDAVTRGLSVAVVEAEDWAAGTSSRSSKLIHGGLRYLEMLDFALVREALQERALMLNQLAPHLVHGLPFLYPLRHRLWERPYVGAGIALYDTISLSPGTPRCVPRHRHLSKRKALRLAPSLDPATLTGAVQYWDAQVDDARHTMTLVRTAARYGARCVNRARLVELTTEAGKVTGGLVEDVENGRRFRIRARQVINATGVWTDKTTSGLGRSAFRVQASKGVHLMLRRSAIDSSCAMITRTEKSVLLVLPWGAHWLVGTTDTPWDLDRGHPVATSADVDYLLEHLNAALARPVTRDDIEAVYAGLRPLVAGDTADTTKLSREHVVDAPYPGLVVVAGGKYTTYRVMAEGVVDVAVERMGAKVGPSITRSVPLLGADGYHALINTAAAPAARWGLRESTIRHLLDRYGSIFEEVLDPAQDDPSLLLPLTGAGEYLAAEVVYAVTHEGALHLDDVLERRTRISIETADGGVEAARQVAAVMAGVLGWDERKATAELGRYRARREAERAARLLPDESEAVALTIAADQDATVERSRSAASLVI